MSRLGKVFLGVATFYPLVHLVAFLTFIALSLHDPGLMDTEAFRELMVSHFVSAGFSLLLLVFYSMHALKWSNRLENETSRLLWVLILFAGNLLAMPAYFILHVLPEREAGDPEIS